MIGFKNNRPLLQHGTCLISEYGDDWIGEALQRAADQAGTTLPFKDDLVQSIKFYLENYCDLELLHVEELFGRIRKMLTEVGLGHLAFHLKCAVPPVPINVADIARDFPLWLFFQSALHSKVSDLGEFGVTKYSFVEKKACVLAIQGSEKWTKRSEFLLSELDFILSRYERAN